jgi:inositol phosphorylceramide mannosyltransferase catalytic subunit
MQNRIPARIIQTGQSRNLPLLAKAAAANLQCLNPNFEYLFFDDAAALAFIETEFPKHLETFEAFRFRIQRFDFFRYLAVFRLGGFYFDLDVFLAESISDLLCHEAVFPFEELTLNRFLREHLGMDWEIGNYAFGASPGNAFLGSVIENCVRAQREPQWLEPMMRGIPAFIRPDFYVFNSTGPGLVSRTLAEELGQATKVTVLFPENVCDPSSWHQFGRYGVHAMSGSWRPKSNFVRSRLARACESWARNRLMVKSVRLGPKRETGMARVELSLAIPGVE